MHVHKSETVFTYEHTQYVTLINHGLQSLSKIFQIEKKLLLFSLSKSVVIHNTQGFKDIFSSICIN